MTYTKKVSMGWLVLLTLAYTHTCLPAGLKRLLRGEIVRNVRDAVTNALQTDAVIRSLQTHHDVQTDNINMRLTSSANEDINIRVSGNFTHNVNTNGDVNLHLHPTRQLGVMGGGFAASIMGLGFMLWGLQKAIYSSNKTDRGKSLLVMFCGACLMVGGGLIVTHTDRIAP